MKIAFLRKGQQCPEWLQKIEFADPGGFQVVGCASVVYAKNGSYIWRPLFPGFDCLLRVDGNGGKVSIHGQSPANGNGGVILYLRPIVDWPWFVLAAAACCALLKG